MASVEQVEAWQKEIEQRAGLSSGYTDGFSLVRFRKEQALKAPSLQQDIPGSIDEFCRGDVILLDLRPFVLKLQQLFSKVAAIF